MKSCRMRICLLFAHRDGDDVCGRARIPERFSHGTLVALESRVRIGEKVILQNPENWDEIDGDLRFKAPQGS